MAAKVKGEGKGPVNGNPKPQTLGRRVQSLYVVLDSIKKWVLAVDAKVIAFLFKER